jgi:hypothetical protein
MALREAKGVQARFTRYIESLVSEIGQARCATIARA